MALIERNQKNELDWLINLSDTIQKLIQKM